MSLRHGKWFWRQQADCDACQTFSEGLENFHTALGRERDRVSVSEVQASDLKDKQAAIWVIDPLGNVVLRFEPEINPTLILQDMKKLLKLSKVG
jgi:cytochrome oxidase Cu insertion factor (SCO1/SenC/PrrC family)